MPQVPDDPLQRIFHAGQAVVWQYSPRDRRRHIVLVDAEVVQPGPFRVRIRVRIPDGSTLLRWVHPNRLRPKEPGEPVSSYPQSEETV